IVPVPDATTLARYTREVYALSPFSNTRIRPTVRPSDRPSQLKHVVYVIRENRTYDQVFGDVPTGNGEPSLAIFNDSVTPKAAQMARRWVLFDNFYVDGEVSADGHEWTDRAFASEYNEKTWPQNYSGRRQWDFRSGEDVANPRGAYLWDAALAKGRWVVNFGEMTDSTARDSSDWRPARASLPGLRAITVPNYPVFALEDDAQNGPDHVDAHRSVLVLASPYARGGVVDSTFYTTSSVVRSIGLILDLEPLSQYDAGATPLWSAFSRRVDVTPFTHVPNVWPLDERNAQAFRSRIPARDLAEADAADEALLNWEIWTSVHPGSAPPPVRRSVSLGPL